MCTCTKRISCGHPLFLLDFIGIVLEVLLLTFCCLIKQKCLLRIQGSLVVWAELVNCKIVVPVMVFIQHSQAFCQLPVSQAWRQFEHFRTSKLLVESLWMNEKGWFLHIYNTGNTLRLCLEACHFETALPRTRRRCWCGVVDTLFGDLKSRAGELEWSSLSPSLLTWGRGKCSLAIQGHWDQFFFGLMSQCGEEA